MSSFGILSTEGLFQRLGSPDLSLIDVRPVEAYNGWPLKGEPRGGHIRGARNLPAGWTKYLDWLDIVESKGFVPSQELVLYGYESNETEAVARNFQKAGFENVLIYQGFLSDWCTHSELPMARLSRYKHLVSASWLSELFESGKAPEYDNDRFVLCHAHYRNPSAYDVGHIPRAIELDTNTLESPETWNRRSPAELQATLETNGITHDTTVILYGRFDFPDNTDPFPGSSAGQLAAMRCAFIMLYAGVKDVRVLNGGLQAWVDAGYEVTLESTRKQPVNEFGVSIPQQPELAVDLPEAKTILKNPQANLVSVRSWPEFIGQVSGYNYIEPKGRIPGAVFGNCGSDAYHMENYRNVDHTTREFGEIQQLWAEVGITADKHNAFYCGTGWRGSEAWFNAWLMGWPRVSVFDGGWFEWSNDETNPIETGEPTPREA